MENFEISIIKSNNFESENLANLSKKEILDLMEKSSDFKNEILKKIPNEVYWPKGVDQNAVEVNEFSEEYGFKVGSAQIEDNEDGKVVDLDLYCKREKYLYDTKTESIFYRYYLADKKGNVAGIMNVKNFSYDLCQKLIENYSEKSLKKEFNLSKNLLKYGDDPNEKPKSFIHVDSIQSFRKGCGTMLHQIAVEHSLREGFEGRCQLYADYLGSSERDDNVVTSAGFHENFGYFYKDVYDYNRGGELRHKGEEIHAALAKSRWEEAEKWKKEHPREKTPKSIKDNYRPLADKAALIAFFPEHAVLREKERMFKHQNLRINLETLYALEEKHKK